MYNGNKSILIVENRYVGSYIPGGISTLRYGTSYIGGRVVSILPI
jgi:hypothetical protein